MHVDDVTTRVVHEDKGKALAIFIEAAAMLVHRIEGDKELNFSSSKAMLLSNDGELLKEAVRCMGERAGTLEVAVRRLGYDYTVSVSKLARGKFLCKGC